MRRSIAAVALSLALLAGFPLSRASHAGAHAVPGPGPAALLVGIGWNDPASSVEAGVWAARLCVRLMELAEDAFQRLKEDVRRAQHPMRAPHVQPVDPTIAPELRPVPAGPRPRRLEEPAPIPDSLPARSIS